MRTWDPVRNLTAPDAVDRYAAAKAIPHRVTDARKEQAALLARLKGERDDRVALEIAASAARLQAEGGIEHVAATVWNHERADLRLEAVLILSELGTTEAATELKRIATATEFSGNELRQAATWGLGKAGCKAFAELVDLLGDADDTVALHAIAAFGPDTPASVVKPLVGVLRSGSARERAAASEALRLIGSDAVLRALVEALRGDDWPRTWLLVTLGRLDAERVRSALAGDPLMAELEPLLALGPRENWLASPEIAVDLRFLLLQDVPA